MKKIITSVALVALITFYLPACKKSDKQKTTQEKILGNWQLQTIVYNEHTLGQDHVSTTSGLPNDILDFRTDGKVYSSLSNYLDTASYSLAGDTKIVLDGTDSYDITKLTSTNFILYQKNVYTSSSEYDETTITMKR